MHNGHVISRYGSLPRVSVKVGPTYKVSLDLDLTVNVKKCQKLTHYMLEEHGEYDDDYQTVTN